LAVELTVASISARSRRSSACRWCSLRWGHAAAPLVGGTLTLERW